METERRECSECGRYALVETIERNDGSCELCAKGKITDAGEESLSQTEVIVLMGLSLLGSALASGYIVWRCLEADWGWFWSLFMVVWVFPLTYNVISFLIGSVMWLYRKVIGSD